MYTALSALKSLPLLKFMIATLTVLEVGSLKT